MKPAVRESTMKIWKSDLWMDCPQLYPMFWYTVEDTESLQSASIYDRRLTYDGYDIQPILGAVQQNNAGKFQGEYQLGSLSR